MKSHEMKKALSSAILAIGFSAAVSAAVVKEPSIRPAWSGAEPGVWTMDYETALAKAKEAGVYTLMYYSGLWWCPHCQALEEKALTTEAWADFVAANGFYETVLDFPNRAGTGYWCWLWETNYVAETGLSMDEAKAEIEHRYAVQDSYAAPGAVRQYNVPTWDATMQDWDRNRLIEYGRIGYPSLLLVRPDGRVAGRFSVGMTVASLDYVTNRIEQLKRADDWDEADDYRATATKLEPPACEDLTVEQGFHTLSLVDRNDWYCISITNEVGKYWEFSFSPNGDLPTVPLHVQIYLGDSGTPLLDTDVTPAAGANLGFVPAEPGDYFICVSAADNANAQVVGYAFAYQYILEPAATVGFAETDVSVPSDAGSVTLQVTISGASKASEVILDYAAVNGTATNGVDYVLNSGMIEWAAGTSKKTKKLKIPIIASDVWKGDRTFSVVLRPQKHCALAEVISTCKVTIKDAIARNAGKLTFKKAAAKTTATLTEGTSYEFTVSRTGGSDGKVKAVLKVVEDGVSLGTVTNIVWEHGDTANKTFLWTPPLKSGIQPDFAGKVTLTAKAGASAGTYTTINYLRRDELVQATFAEYNAERLGSAASVSGDDWFYGYRPGEKENPVLRSVELTKSTKLSVAATGPAIVLLEPECLGGATMTVKMDKTLLTNRVDGSALQIAVPDGSHTILLTAKKGSKGSFVTAGLRILNLANCKMVPQSPFKATAVPLVDGLKLKAAVKVADGLVVPLAVETLAGTSSKSLRALATSSGRVLSDEGTFAYPATASEEKALAAVLKVGKTLYWRMDTAFTDVWGHRAVQKGTTSKFEVVSATAVLADLSASGLPSGWTTDGVGSVTLPDLTVGVAVPPAVLPFANVPSGAKVSATIQNGTLPEGLSLLVTADGLCLSGVPTVAVAETTFDVFLSSVKGKTTTKGASVRLNLAVRPLGDVAATYNGCRTSDTVAERGGATVKVGSTGKISGSFVLNGQTYAFAATSFSARTNDTFYLSGVEAVNEKRVRKVDMMVDIVDTGRMSDARILLSSSVRYELFRNLWKNSPAKEELAGMAGYYTAALPVAAANPADVAPRGTGYLTAKIKTSGAVTYAGIDSLGKPFSGSSVVLRRPDCCSEAPWNYAFYIETKPEGSTATGAGLWGLVLLTEATESGKYVLSADVGLLTLVNLTSKSVYGYSKWTNALEVVGGCFDVSAPFAGKAASWRLDGELGAFADRDGRGGTSGYMLASAPKDLTLKVKSTGKLSVAKNVWSFAPSSFDAKTGLFTMDFNILYANWKSVQKNRKVSAKGVFVQRSVSGQSFWAGLYTLPETATYKTSAGAQKTYKVDTPFPFELMEPNR